MPIFGKRNKYPIRLVVLGIFVLAASYPLGSYFSETFSGTILAFSATSGSVIALADSRLTKVINGKTIPAGDGGCKIVALSKTSLFFFSGLLNAKRDESSNDVIFDAMELARAASRRFAKEPDSIEKLKKIGASWSDMIRPKLDEAFKLMILKSPEYGLGGFGGFDSNGKPILILVDLGVQFTGGKTTNTVPSKIYQWPTDPNRLVGYGGPGEDSFAEFFANSTPRARSANEEFFQRSKHIQPRDMEAERLVSAMESAIKWSNDPAVGGYVDAAIIEPHTGIRWVDRKYECDKEDN